MGCKAQIDLFVLQKYKILGLLPWNFCRESRCFCVNFESSKKPLVSKFRFFACLGSATAKCINRTGVGVGEADRGTITLALGSVTNDPNDVIKNGEDEWINDTDLL